MKLPETYLIEVFRPEAKHILELLTKTGDNQEDKDIQNYYKKLAQWGTEHLQKAGEIVLDKIELSYKDEIIKLGLVKRTKDLWGMINALIELMKKYSANTENVKIIQQTTLEILAGLSKMQIPKKAEADSEPDPDPDPKPDPKEDPKDDPVPDPKSGKSRDWTAYRAKKLASGKPTSKALKEFYDEYYSVEYASTAPEKKQIIIDKLHSLDKILTVQFNKLGYNIDVNPFAAFLKILLEKKRFDIFDKLTYNTYGALHNAFIDKKITGNMLGNYPDATKKENILFCGNLYNYKGLDIVEYLSLQHQALGKLDEAKYKDYAKDQNFLSKMFIQQRFDGDKSYAENMKALFNSKNTAVVDMYAGGAKLKSLLEIRELYNHIFGTAAKKTIDTNTINKILDTAIKRNIAPDLLRYLLRQNGFTKAYKTTAENAVKVLAKLKHKSTDENLDKVQQLLDDYDELSLDVEKKIADSLIGHLVEKAGGGKT